MTKQVLCESCGKVPFDITELQVEELIPGVAREQFVLRCPECGYDRQETAYESEAAEERYLAVDEAIQYLGSVQEAVTWLDRPAKALGQATPRSQLETREGAARVRTLIDDLWDAERAVWEKRSALAQARFREWVVKWSIGPGMDDQVPVDAKERYGVEPLWSASGAPLYSGASGYVGPGWLPILERLASELVVLGWDCDLRQVKEKLGGLRFYIGNGSDEIHERVHQAERESLETCEDCGSRGTPQRGRRGWVRTVCAGCAEALRNFE